MRALSPVNPSLQNLQKIVIEYMINWLRSQRIQVYFCVQCSSEYSFTKGHLFHTVQTGSFSVLYVWAVFACSPRYEQSNLLPRFSVWSWCRHSALYNRLGDDEERLCVVFCGRRVLMYCFPYRGVKATQQDYHG